MIQPIGETYSLPPIVGYFTVVNNGLDREPDWTCEENQARCAEVYSTHGEVEETYVDSMWDGDLSTTYSAYCETSEDGVYYAEINILFWDSIPLQTVAIASNLGDTGHIFKTASDGAFEYCATDVLLDGFHRCDMWTDNLTIRKYCDTASTDPNFNVVTLGAITYAEAGSWDWITAVSVGDNEVSFDGLFGNSQSTYGVDGYLWYGTISTLSS
jgi:hypothetical protein